MGAIFGALTSGTPNYPFVFVVAAAITTAGGDWPSVITRVAEDCGFGGDGEAGLAGVVE